MELDQFAAFVDAQLANAVVGLSACQQTPPDAPSDSSRLTRLSMLCSTHTYLVFEIWTLLKDAVASSGGVQFLPLLAEARSRARAELKRLAMHVRVRVRRARAHAWC